MSDKGVCYNTNNNTFSILRNASKDVYVDAVKAQLGAELSSSLGKILDGAVDCTDADRNDLALTIGSFGKRTPPPGRRKPLGL